MTICRIIHLNWLKRLSLDLAQVYNGGGRQTYWNLLDIKVWFAIALKNGIGTGLSFENEIYMRCKVFCTWELLSCWRFPCLWTKSLSWRIWHVICHLSFAEHWNTVYLENKSISNFTKKKEHQS